jgi:O-antigen/teichoic acid export membrane protein
VALATALANALGYLLTIVAARALAPAGFGAFSALLAAIIIGNVAALAVQAVVARDVAQAGPSDARGALATGLAAGALALALSPVLARVLQIPSVAPVAASAVAVAALAAAAGPIGVAQGRERLGTLAGLLLAQGALRVLGGMVGLLTNRSVTGAMTGLAGGLVAAAVISWAVVRPTRSTDRPGLHGRQVWSAAVVLLGFVAFTNADVIVARAVLSPVESGAYGAGSIVTKIAFWLPQFVPVVAYARLSRQQHRSRALRVSLVAVTLSGSLILTTTALAGDLILRVLAGNRYLELAPALWWFALLGAVLALAQVTVYSALARRDATTTVIVWMALMTLIAASASASTVVQVVSRATAVALVLLAVTLVREARRPLTARAEPIPVDGSARKA